MNRPFLTAWRGPILMIFILMALLGACNLSRSDGGGPTDMPVQQTWEGGATGGSPGPTNTDGAAVTYIPPTTFVMGAAASDTLADDDEHPAHQVSLDGFYIYTREVTNRMYAECVRAGACFPVQPLPNGPTSHYNDPAYADYPVVGVDWNMARDYCHWAGGRLPTEAEWELAARGAEGFLYPWGDDPGPACDRLNMFGCLTPPDTRQVGAYPLGISPFGLLDMSGNVWEWVNDWYGADYYAASPAANPFGPFTPSNPEQPFKVVRGGSWNSYPQDVRATARAFAHSHFPYDDLGFRCVAQTESWPIDLTLPAPGHALPDSSGPSQVGARIGENPDLWAELAEVFSTCPDASGNVHLHIRFDVSEEFENAYRFSGALYSTGADTFPCAYDSTQHLLHCAGPADRLGTRPGGMGDRYYVAQVCTMDRATNRAVACRELYVLQETHCTSENWMTGCDVVCNQAASIDLVCKSNDPALIEWVEEELTHVLIGSGEGIVGGWTVPSDCTRIYEPPGGPPQDVVLICPGTVPFQPDPDGNLTFHFCAESACPHFVSLPYPANCLPPDISWQLLGYGCQNENIAFVTIDTGLSDLQDRLNGYRVYDCENTCACVPVGGHPSWLYCYCPEPTTECPMTICLTIGGVEHCQEFPRAGFLPCEAPQQPEEPQPVDPCNQYTTPDTCKEHGLPPESCWWDSAAGVCKSP